MYVKCIPMYIFNVIHKEAHRFNNVKWVPMYQNNFVLIAWGLLINYT